MTPLHLVAEDTRVKIVKIDAGIGLVRQLKSKGIHVGDVVTVMHNSQGPLIMAKIICVLPWGAA